MKANAAPQGGSTRHLTEHQLGPMLSRSCQLKDNCTAPLSSPLCVLHLPFSTLVSIYIYTMPTGHWTLQLSKICEDENSAQRDQRTFVHAHEACVGT